MHASAIWAVLNVANRRRVSLLSMLYVLGSMGVDDRLSGSIDVDRRGRPIGHRPAHHGLSVPRRATSPASSLRLHRRDHRMRLLVAITETHGDLIEDDIVEHFDAGLRTHEPCETLRVTAAAFDEG